MRPKFILWFVMSLVCFSAVGAQSVDEIESRLIFEGSTARFTLAIDNPRPAFTGKIELALIDEKDQTVAESAHVLTYKTGRADYRFAMPIGNLLKSANRDLVWYRLRYRTPGKTGYISLSELLKDIFELRSASSEHLFPGALYRVRVRAVQAFTKQPVKGVRIDGELELELDTDRSDDTLKLTRTGKTDGDGFAILDFDIPADIHLSYGSEIKITGLKNGFTQMTQDSISYRGNEGSVFLTADKPIYQPGQSFNVRGIYFDANNNVMAGSKLEFAIKDEDDTVLYEETVKTSAYGIASISWKVPENAKLGAYNVTVDADEDLGQNRLYFKVSRYDLPQFTVQAAPDKTFYLPGQASANVTIDARYLFGKAVAKGHVRVVQESERHWSWSKQKYDFQEGQSVEGETGADGKFTAVVDLSKDHDELKSNEWNVFKDLNFSAYFTDPTTNRTEQKRFDIRVSKEPIHIYFIRYSDNNVNLPVNAYLSTFYADGTPAVCDVSILGEEKPVAKLKTNSLGAGKFSFKVPAEDLGKDPYHLKITARNKNGQAGTRAEEYEFDSGEAMTLGIEKAILNTAENIRIDLRSSKKEAFVYVDVLKDRSALGSYFMDIRNGRGSLEIPYLPAFKGELTIAAYYYDEKEQRTIRIARGVIYPAPQNLELGVKFDGSTFRPGDDVKINFSVLDGVGKAAESALGVVVFDKAVEERARTDAEFESYFSRFYDLMGYDRSFGDISIQDVNELDLSKPVSPELQLAAEIMLAGNYYYPHIERSKLDVSAPGRLYNAYFKEQLLAVEKALDTQYKKDFSHPIDERSLKYILSENAVDFDRLFDPWGQNYAPAFTTEKTQHVLKLKSNGADKKPGTEDDISVFIMRFDYFTPVGNTIDKAVSEYHKRTGEFIRDLPTLTEELARQGVDLGKVKDPWGWNYRIFFEVSGRYHVIRFHSDGPNAFYEPNYWYADDFDVWKTSADYFTPTEVRINEVLTKTTKYDKKPFPATEGEFTEVLRKYGVALADIRDGYGKPAYLAMVKQIRLADGAATLPVNTKMVPPGAQEEIIFLIRSAGADKMKGYDDFNIGAFSSFVTDSMAALLSSATTIRISEYTGIGGAIKGVVFDSNGAVIPGASITVTGQDDTGLILKTISNSDGEFLLENIPTGLYQVRADSTGFKSMITTDVRVAAQKAVEMQITMQAGGITETVTVTAESSQINQTSNASVTTVTRSKGTNISFPTTEQTSTPRLREYFPETLVWNPELITDKKGKAELKFKLADNITTWKMYAIASTKKGKIGVAEKEFTAFQPFFVDLDPPKFLTSGDEISLPVTVRNYTDKKQNVALSMAKGAWFSFLEQDKRQLEVEPGSAQNAVFGFKAISPVKDGKQRVTAIAQKESDAIEKPVTVRPNGKEVVKTQSRIFRGSAEINVDFPANTLPGTHSAELKIFPNLMAHVSEAVEGLLQRPYGCGEQTISSTYPNLMILKFSKTDDKLHRAAKEYLKTGYDRLLSYQSADGGFSYWGGSSPSDIAVTAYAIRFLNDADEELEVDENVIDRASAWLAGQQRADGSWAKYADDTPEYRKRSISLTGYIARVLAMSDGKSASLSKALAYLKTRRNELMEPYALAQFGLALADAGDISAAKEIAAALEKMAVVEGGAAHWNANGSTPFNGWGSTANIETTALVAQLLIKLKAAGAGNDDLVSGATLFLLKNKDRYGVWYSTQTTINVLDAFIMSLGSNTAPGQNEIVQLFVNGVKAQDISVSSTQIAPVVLNITDKLNPAENRVEVKAPANLPLMSQLVSTHYIDWKDSEDIGLNAKKALRLSYNCDKQDLEIMQEVNCSVEVNRTGYGGDGMLLAEIGTPPGADVSRESLQKAMAADWTFSRYDILPDRIVVYFWARSGGTKFNFSFRPRYGINAQTPPSLAYDYYNPEAQAVIAPLKFSVK